MRIHDILMQLPDEYHVMDDVMLKTTNGTTQIDHIVVSKYGVFAIETKNYCGEIYGNDNTQEWKQIIVTDVTYPKKPWKTYTYVTKNQFYNPVKQAVGHMYRIKENLKEWPYLKVIPIVVFLQGMPTLVKFRHKTMSSMTPHFFTQFKHIKHRMSPMQMQKP